MALDHGADWKFAVRRLIQADAPVVSSGMQVETAAIALQLHRLFPGLIRRGVTMSDERRAAANDAAEWIKAIALRQDRAAFASLFDSFAPRIKSMLMRSGATADAAEDLAQEALLTVWRKAAYFTPERASAAAWIYTIARNLRVDRLRDDKRAAQYAPLEMTGPEAPESPDDALSASERDERVRSALKQLSQEQMRVVQLSFFEGRAHGDIAARLNLPLGTVKSRVRLAMARLRNLLGDLQ
jgi:RNA polymerase sigma-70 factor, ECF subfamily